LSALDAQRAIGAMAQAVQLPTGRLVVIEREARCSVCGKRLSEGVEARRWFGQSFVHTSCASELAASGDR
jgi:hypothetical protein